MLTSIPYILVVCIFAFCAFWTERGSDKTRLYIDVLCSVVFLSFWGLRGDVGNDYAGYSARFQDIEWSNIADFFLHHDSITAFEPGFIVSVILCRSIYPVFPFFVFLCTTFTYFLTYRYLSDNVKNVPFALVIFTCMGGLQLHVDFIRSSISLALFLYSIRYIERRKLREFLLLNLIGLSFHVSALLYIPIYFLYGTRVPYKVFISIGIVGALLYLFQIPLASYICIFIDKICWGINNAPVDLSEFSVLPTIPIGAIERLLTGGILLFCYRRSEELHQSDYYRFYLTLFFVYYFFSSFLWDFPIISMRLSLMFSFVYCIVWVSIFERIMTAWKKIFFLIIIGVYMFLRLIAMTSSDAFIYSTILND